MFSIAALFVIGCLVVKVCAIPSYSTALTWAFDRDAMCYSKCIGTGKVTKTIYWRDHYGIQSKSNATQAIQAALDAINKAGGGTLNIRAGNYSMSGPILVYSNTCVRGAGMYKTILKLKDNASPWKTAGLIRLNKYAKSVTVADLSGDGNRKNNPNYPDSRYGYFSDAAKYTCLDRVRIANFQRYGFDPHGNKVKDIASGYGEHLYFDGCLSENNGKDGFTVDQTVYVTLKNCISRNNDRHGIQAVTGTRYIRIENNTVEGNGFKFPDYTGSGIVINDSLYPKETIGGGGRYGTGDVVLYNNRVSNSARSSFMFYNSTEILVDKNTAINPASNSGAYCFSINNVDAYTASSPKHILLSSNYCKSAYYYKTSYPKGSAVPVTIESSNVYVKAT